MRSTHQSPLFIYIYFQVELDRFQATLQILRIYYLGMRSDILPELSPDILKVALQEAVEIRDKYEKHKHSLDSILNTFQQDGDQLSVERIVRMSRG